MATIQEIREHAIANPNLSDDIVRGMLAKAEDLPKAYQQPLKDPVEESQGFTDTFAPTAIAKKAIPVISKISSPEGRSELIDKGGQALIDGVKTNLRDLPLQPYKGMYDIGKSTIDSISEPIGRALGGDPKAPGALLGSLANLALPSALGKLADVAGPVAKGIGSGLMDSRNTTLIGTGRAALTGGVKGLIEGITSPGRVSAPISPTIDRLSSGTDMLSQATADPNALETMLGNLKPLPEPVQNVTGQSARPLTPNLNLSRAVNPKGPIAGVKPGITMNDIFKQMPEKVSNPEPTIETALKAVSNPTPNVADKALAKAQQLLQYETEPSEIAKLKQRIDILKSMAEGMRKSEVF